MSPEVPVNKTRLTSKETIQLPIGGIIVPMITPMKFNEKSQFEIDETASDKLIEALIKNGAGTLFIFGFAGGCTKGIPVEDRKKHLEHVIQTVNNRIPVVVGIADANIHNTISLARHAEEKGAQAAVLLLNQLPESYDKQIEGVLQKARNIPLILYNNPHMGQKGNLSSTDLETMMDLYPRRIIGLKESSGNETRFISFVELQKKLAARGISFALFMGDATKIAWILEKQDKLKFSLPGAVPVEANIPERASLYNQLYKTGKAEELQMLSIPDTIDYLIKNGWIDKATLTFWNQP